MNRASEIGEEFPDDLAIRLMAHRRFPGRESTAWRRGTSVKGVLPQSIWKFHESLIPAMGIPNEDGGSRISSLPSIGGFRLVQDTFKDLLPKPEYARGRAHSG